MPDLNRAKVRIDRFAAQSNLANEREVEAENPRMLYASQERKFLAANGILSIQQKFNEACELRDVVKAAEILVAARVDLDSVNRADFTKLWEHLKEHGGSLVKAKVQDLVGKKYWKDAKKELDRVTNSAAVAEVLEPEVISKLLQSDRELIWSP